MFPLTKHIQLLGHCAFAYDTLFLTDVHIGFEQALNKQGVMIPRSHFDDIIKELKKVLEKTNPKKVVICGDLKHEFGKISEAEWRHTIKFLDLCSQYANEMVLIKGNHDTILGPIAKKKNVILKGFDIIKDILALHGDVIIENLDKLIKESNIKTIIMGHEHPAITLTDGARSEKYPCFLKGSHKKTELLVLPAFSPLAQGSDILKEKLLSPFLQKDLTNFNVFVVGDEILDFGKVKNLE